MTTSKWPLWLAKLALMGWLIANTGFFVLIINAKNEEPSPEMKLMDKVVEEEGNHGLWKRENLLNRCVWSKADSVKALIARGHKYGWADYFRDLKGVWDYAESVSPWMKHPMSISDLTALVDREEKLVDGESERLRCEILGVCQQKSQPTDWSAVFGWFARQYFLGLLPALLMCIILAHQRKIRFSPKTSPVSSALYLALWPINFFILLRRTFEDIDHEARLRTQKDSLFGKLGNLEENFLSRIRESGSRKAEADFRISVLGTANLRARYVCAIFAVIIIRIIPSIAHEAEQSIVSEQNIEMANPSPLIAFGNDASDHEDCVCFFTNKDCYDRAIGRIVWWPSLEVLLLFGYRTCLEHVPLGKTDLSSVRLTQN